MTPAQRVEAALVGALINLSRVLGPVPASNLGGWLARRIGPSLPVTRVAQRNLQLAMPALDAAARRRVIAAAWDNLGRTMAELPHLAALGATPSGPGWELVGETRLTELAHAGGPAILFSGHFANWELLFGAALRLGLPMAALYRAAANPAVDQLLMAMRSRSPGATGPMFAKGAAGARGTLNHLRAGGVLCLLMDQKMNDGVPARLFGHQAMTASALAALALRFRCPVIPCHAERLGPARCRLVVGTPLAMPDTGDRTTDIAALTQAVNDTIETWIRARPGEWLWMHRRWPKQAYARNGLPRLLDRRQDPPAPRAAQEGP